MTESVQSYYNRIGAEYDQNRFGNTYGAYIHSQEKAFLNHWLKKNPGSGERVLDMGCGTGRFMSRATHGVDFSDGMMEQARKKFPEKQFVKASITATGLEDGSFTKVFSMHVLMHLDEVTSRQFFEEAYRLLQPGGLFIVDFPSRKRRSFGQRKAGNWHGSNAYDVPALPGFYEGRWKLVGARGILFFPIHRIPVRLRSFVRFFDNLLCRSWFKGYASYIVVVLQKR